MENVMLEKSKGATYMSFLLDVEIIIKKDGISANLAESKMKSESKDIKKSDKESKSKGSKENETEQVIVKKEGSGKKGDEVKVYTAEVALRDVFKNIADESPSEKVLMEKQSKQSETNTCLDNISNILQDYKNHAMLKGGKIKKKRKTDQTAKAFKGKVEPIDFWECNRIFLCNRLELANKKRFTNKYYGKKKPERKLKKTVSNTQILNSQLSTNPFSPGTLYRQTEYRSLPNIGESLRTTHSFASFKNQLIIGNNSSQNTTALFTPPAVYMELNLGDSINGQKTASASHYQLCVDSSKTDIRDSTLSDVETGKLEKHERDSHYDKLFNKNNNSPCYNNITSQKKPKYFKIFTTKLHNALSKSRKGHTGSRFGRPKSTKIVNSWPVLHKHEHYLKKFDSCPSLNLSSMNILAEDRTNTKEKAVKPHKNTSIQHSGLTNGTKQEKESKTNEMKKQNNIYLKRSFKNVITSMLKGGRF